MKVLRTPTAALPRTQESRAFSAVLLPFLLCSAGAPLVATGPERLPIEHRIEIRSSDKLAARPGGIDADMLAELSRSLAPFELKLRNGSALAADIEPFLEQTYKDVVVLRDDDNYEYMIVWKCGLPYQRCVKKVDLIIDDPRFVYDAKVTVETSMTLP